MSSKLFIPKVQAKSQNHRELVQELVASSVPVSFILKLILSQIFEC